MPKLSILIPARNEEYLNQTVDDIYRHAEDDVQVLVGLDGWQPWEGYVKSESIFKETPIGQRAMTNLLAKIATGDYLMKLDAHCSLSQGFDVELMKLAKEATVVVPALTNLHVYDWVCDKRHRKACRQFERKLEDYEILNGKIIKVPKNPGKIKMACEQCGGIMKKELVWRPIPKPVMTNYYFDTNLHFQYCEEQDEEHFETETMSIQGSCFMISKEDYFRLNICDENFGSWGQQGTEIACKVYLSGGRIISTRNCFYSHWFREFPYANPVDKILETQKLSREIFLGNKIPGQIKPISWLIEQFKYPGDWTEKKVAELCLPWKR